MPEKGKKSLPINEETHRLIKAEAAKRGVFVSDLIDTMWDVYRQSARQRHDSQIPMGSLHETADLTPEEREWVEALVRYLRSDEPFKEHILEIMRTAFNMPSAAAQPRKRAAR